MSSKENESEKIEIEGKEISNRRFSLDFLFLRFFYQFLVFPPRGQTSFSYIVLLDSKLTPEPRQTPSLKNSFCFLFFPPPPFLADQSIFQAYHLREAQKAGLNSKIFKPVFKILIQAIIVLYPKSTDSAPELASSNKKIRSKKKKKISQTESDISFSEQWAIDESLITKAMNQLKKSTYAFQDSLAFKTVTDQNSTPFVRVTPESSPPRTSVGSPPSPITDFFSERVETPTNTSEVLVAIENEQKSSKKFVSIFQPVWNIQNILISQLASRNPILSEAFSWQESVSPYFSPSTALSINDSNRKSSFFFEASEAVLISTPLRAGLNQSLKLAKATSFRPAYSPTTPRISALRENPQVRFAFSPVNLFDFFNTVVSSSTFFVSSRSVASNHFFLRNFLRSPNIDPNEEAKSKTIEKKLSLRPKSFSNAESPENPNSPIWKEKSIQSVSFQKFKNSSSDNPSEQKGSTEIELNLDPFKPRIQELKNSQSLFSSPDHHFSSNVSQPFSDIPMEADGQNGSGGPDGPGGQGGMSDNDPPSGPNLSQQDIQKIALSMFNLFRDNIAPKNDANAPNNSSGNDDRKASFRPQDVEFFDFILDESYGPGDVVQIKRDVYYRNVYLFVERIKNAVNMYTAEKVRSSLSSCLKKTVQIWYTEGLSDLKKKILRSLNIEVEKWCDALIKKFKQSVSSALQSFSSESYSLDDLKNKRDMSSFVFAIMRHAKAANIADVHGQLIWIYNAIASELARDIDSPKETISVSIFFKQFDNKREIWFRIYSRKFNKGSSEYGYQFFFKYQNFYSKYDKDDKGAYKPNQNQPQIVGRQERLLLAPSNEKSSGDSQTSDRSSGNDKNAFSSEQKQNTQSQSADSFWYRQPLKDYNSGERGGYRNGFTSNSWDRRGRGNFYRSNRWQDRSDRYENREQYQKTYAGEERFYEKKPGPFESYENIDSNEEFDGEESSEFYSYNLHPESPDVCKKCDKPKKDFPFNNAFHSHIRSCPEKKPLVKIIQKKIPNLPVIKSSAPFVLKNELGFRSYQYAIVWFRVAMKSQMKAIADTGCSMNLIDEDYLKNILPNLIISRMPAPINVRGIGNALHECIIYVMLNIFLNGIFQAASIRRQLHKKFHIVKDLKCKILLEMDILDAKQMNIDLFNKVMMIPTCKNLVVSIRIALKPNARIKKIVHSKKKITISIKSVVKVPTYLKKKKLPDNRDYLFEPNQADFTAAFEKIEGFYTHICDCNLSFVQVKNDLFISMALPKRARLGTLTEYEKKKCYQVEAEYHEAVIVIDVKEHYAWLRDSDQSQDFSRVTCETQNRQ